MPGRLLTLPTLLRRRAFRNAGALFCSLATAAIANDVLKECVAVLGGGC